MRLMFIGIVVVLCGFTFDMFFAGLPYQDPTAEQQARWLLNKSIADYIIIPGLILFLCGLIRAAYLFFKRVGGKNR